MGSRSAFFYGTLMVPAVMYRVIYQDPSPPASKRALTQFRPALLYGYCRRRVANADYPGLTKDQEKPENTVRGSYVTGLTDADIRYLDRFEGSWYKREKVQVRLFKGVGLTESVNEKAARQIEEAEAETYVFIAGEDRLEPGEWDFEEFIREKAKYWSGEELVDWQDEGFDDVEALRAEEKGVANDPMGGRGPNGEIGRELAAEHVRDSGEQAVNTQ